MSHEVGGEVGCSAVKWRGGKGAWGKGAWESGGDGGDGGDGGRVPLLAPVSRSSPSGKISIVIDEKEHWIYVPLEGNVRTFRALGAAFLTKHNVLNIGALNEVVNLALKLQLQRNSVLEQASVRAAVMSQSQARV